VTFDESNDLVWKASNACAHLYDDVFTRPCTSTKSNELTYRLLQKVLLAGGTALMSPANRQASAHMTLWGETADCLAETINVAIATAASQVLLLAAAKFPERFPERLITSSQSKGEHHDQ
jgi:hypothetical protein